MKFTLARVKSLVLQRIQREGGTFINTATELKDYINIAGEEYLSHLQTLRPEAFIRNQALQVTGDSKALPSDFYKLISLHVISNGYRYPLQAYSNADTILSATESWGNTRFPGYQLRQSWSSTWHIYFDSAPATTTTLTMLYRVCWVAPSSPSDTIRLPWIDGLILRAAKLCAQKEQAWELANSLTTEIERHDKKTEIWASPVDENSTAGILDTRSHQEW